MSITTINTKSEGDLGYIAGYADKKIGVYAENLYAAKQKAVAHFKPSKKNTGLLWITLAEDSEGNTVTQSTLV